MNIASLKQVVSAEEWQPRVDLAACYRLVALYGWSDLVFTHITARIPGPEHHFLINPQEPARRRNGPAFGREGAGG
jgi:ribulose-5-phosphate 4-epimerase/fuculose-1-phosphate aldolase